jgi:serine/threonine protein phosphatase PrpC
MGIEYATGLDTGTRKKREAGINEDSIAVNVLEDGHLDERRSAGVFVLADGAGGEEGGEIASHAATVEVTRRLTQAVWDNRSLDELAGASGLDDEAVTADLLSARDREWLLDRIDTAIRSTHTRILQYVQEFGLESAYTTIVAGVVVGNWFYYGWVGDSRIYVVNAHPERPDHERMCRLTQDHSIVENLRQRGEIDDTEARVHPQSNRITRALGGTHSEEPSTSTVQVETSRVRLFADDTVLFTSDGLLDAYADAGRLYERYVGADDPAEIRAEILEKTVTDDEIRDVVLEAPSLSTAVDRLVTLANRRGGKDNLSLVLFRGDGLDTSPAEGLPDRTYYRDAVPTLNEPTLIRRD